ncbi:MAG: FIST signal transduction protein [Chitinophagales bacterium]
MKAKSIKGKTTEEIKVALETQIASGYRPTLALVFLSVTEETEGICSLLNEKGIAIFGANTAAEFTEEGVETTGIVVLLLDINPDYFKIVVKDYGNGLVYESACLVGEAGAKAFANPAFIISSANYKIPQNQIVAGLVEKAGKDVTIVGGCAGEAVNFEGKVFTNNESSANGLLSLILDQDKIILKAMAASGWKPIGTEKTITQSKGHWIYTIDDQPAFDVVKKFLGKDIIDGNNTEGIVKLNLTYPLQLHRNAGSPMILPALFANTADQSVMIAGPVVEGSVFRFSMPPDFEVIDMVIQGSKEIKEKELPDADALIIFSCVGRLACLGPMASTEVEGLAGTWNTPMSGFFSLGEFGRVTDGNPEFHGTTVSWVALKEK